MCPTMLLLRNLKLIFLLIWIHHGLSSWSCFLFELESFLLPHFTSCPFTTFFSTRNQTHMQPYIYSWTRHNQVFGFVCYCLDPRKVETKVGVQGYLTSTASVLLDRLSQDREKGIVAISAFHLILIFVPLKFIAYGFVIKRKSCIRF